MGSLIRFELKKIIARKSAKISCAVILAFIAIVMVANVLQTVAFDYETDERYDGLAAIDYERRTVNAHAAVLTPELIASEAAAYSERAFSVMGPAELADLSSEAAYDQMEQRCSVTEFSQLSDPYYRYLFSPWAVASQQPYQTAAIMALDGADAADFYGALRAKCTAELDEGLAPDAVVPLTRAEYDFWQAKIEAVPTPFAYGFAGAWHDILDCVGFLVFAMVAIAVALTPVFAGEYADRTDAVLLSTRYGKSRLVAAKVIASLIFATAFYVLCAALVVAVPLVCYGPDGADLPLQALVSTSPYAVTASQAVWAALGTGYAITLGFSGLTLALSSRLRSQIAIFAIVVCLLLVTGLVAGGASGAVLRALTLFPINALGPGTLVREYLSYAVGPVVLAPETAVTLFWLAVCALCLPVSALVFRRHQVA